MRWKEKDLYRWHTKFAFLPVLIEGYWYWLVRYKQKKVPWIWDTHWPWPIEEEDEKKL